MKIDAHKIVVDTYAWIEYFGGTKVGERVKEFLAGSEYIYTPAIVLAEIARKYIREGVGVQNTSRRLEIIKELSTIVTIDHKIALKSGEAYMELLEHAKKLKLKTKPSLGDAIVLATAQSLNAKVITGDQHFKELEITIWIGE